MHLKQRKNFLPTLILGILFWLILGWFIYSFPPESSLIISIFYFLVFGSIFFTSALIFANSRRGFLLALFVILFLIFRAHQIANFLNIVLLVGIFSTLEIYFSK